MSGEMERDMNRMGALTAKRRDARHQLASSAVDRILRDAGAIDIEITLIGSLARDDFRAHSDVDLLVRGAADGLGRLLVERLVADAMRASGIPYDLIFEDDLTEDRLQELLNDIV
jgi:predicted nucleotidyltransferase